VSADVGNLATEAALLLDAVAERLTAKRDFPAGPDGQPAAACPTCGHQPGESCTACPICRFLAVLRGERPEVTERWVDSALTVVQALRSLIPAAGTAAGTSPSGTSPDGAAPAGPPPTGASPTGATTPTGSPPQGLQHIEIQ